MPTRKNNAEETVDAAHRAFTVVLENIQGDFRAFGEQLSAFGQRLDRMDGRLDGMDAKITDIQCDLSLVKTAVLEHNTLLKDTVRRDEVEALVDSAVARA